MIETTEVVDHYIAIWNETDREWRRALIAQIWSVNGVYCDPLMEAEGHDGIDHMVEGVQQQFGGLQFRRVGEVERHHDRLRFRWELGPAGGPSVAGGTDFGHLVNDRLQSIIGFMDSLPTAGN